MIHYLIFPILLIFFQIIKSSGYYVPANGDDWTILKPPSCKNKLPGQYIDSLPFTFGIVVNPYILNEDGDYEKPIVSKIKPSLTTTTFVTSIITTSTATAPGSKPTKTKDIIVQIHDGQVQKMKHKHDYSSGGGGGDDDDDEDCFDDKNIDMAAKRDYQDMNTQEQANEDSGQVLAESDSHQQVVDQNRQINEEEEETQEQQMQEENNNTNEIEDNKVQEFETIEEIYDDIDNNESRPNNSKKYHKKRPHNNYENKHGHKDYHEDHHHNHRYKDHENGHEEDDHKWNKPKPMPEQEEQEQEQEQKPKHEKSEGYESEFVSPVYSVACYTNSTLKMTLTDGILRDSDDRIGCIVSGHQFQFDGPTPQHGAIYAAGWSVTKQGQLALGDSTKFYQCASGDFYNLYDEPIAFQCHPVTLDVVELIEC